MLSPLACVVVTTMTKKIGIALSGGGARGYSHVGVLKALTENGVSIDLVSGCSAGSLIGGAFASGMSPDEIIEMGENVGWFSIAGFSYSPRGLLSNAALGTFIKEKFPATRFEDLPIPFAALVCDLETGEEITLRDHGDLATAIRASCAIPGVFVPVTGEDGRTLVDGGVVAPMPTRAVRELGADIVIAVDLLASGSTSWRRPRTLLGTLFQTAMFMLRAASKNQHYRADIVIVPQIAHIRMDELGKRDELVELGYKAGLEKVNEIKTLLEPALAAT